METAKPQEKSPPLQRMRKEDMIMLQQEQQSISPDQIETARTMLNVCFFSLVVIPIFLCFCLGGVLMSSIAAGRFVAVHLVSFRLT